MSLAASATRLVWEHSPRRKPLKTLQPVKSQTMEAAPFSGDSSFGESSEESLEMRILDPIHNPGWDHVVALHRDAGCFHTSAWPNPSNSPRTRLRIFTGTRLICAAALKNWPIGSRARCAVRFAKPNAAM